MGEFVLWLFAVAIIYFVLYLVIRAAVRDGILAAEQRKHPDSQPDSIANVTCPHCGKQYEANAPYCPRCGHPKP